MGLFSSKSSSSSETNSFSMPNTQGVDSEGAGVALNVAGSSGVQNNVKISEDNSIYQVDFSTKDYSQVFTDNSDNSVNQYDYSTTDNSVYQVDNSTADNSQTFTDNSRTDNSVYQVDNSTQFTDNSQTFVDQSDRSQTFVDSSDRSQTFVDSSDRSYTDQSDNSQVFTDNSDNSQTFTDSRDQSLTQIDNSVTTNQVTDFGAVQASFAFSNAVYEDSLAVVTAANANIVDVFTESTDMIGAQNSQFIGTVENIFTDSLDTVSQGFNDALDQIQESAQSSEERGLASVIGLSEKVVYSIAALAAAGFLAYGIAAR